MSIEERSLRFTPKVSPCFCMARAPGIFEAAFFFFPICYVQFISRNDELIGILVGLFLCYVFLLLPCRVTNNQFRFDHAYPCFSGKKRLFQSLRPKNMYYVSLPLDYFGLRPCGHLSRRSGSGNPSKIAQDCFESRSENV